MTTPISIVGISGSLQVPSKTDALVDAVAAATASRLDAEYRVVSVGEIARSLSGVVTRQDAGPALEQQLTAIESADVLIVGSPVYKGTYTGLFKHLIDLLDQRSLTDVPVILTATGGSERHALVIDLQLRPLFSFFQALTLPIGVFAHSSDFSGYELVSLELLERVDAAADRAALAVRQRDDGLAGGSDQIRRRGRAPFDRDVASTVEPVALPVHGLDQIGVRTELHP
jgi:FMN reductase